MSRKMSRLFKIIIPSGELLLIRWIIPSSTSRGTPYPIYPLLISPQRGCPFSFQSHPDLKCYCSRAKQQRPQYTFFWTKVWGLTCATAHFDVSSPRNQPKPCESPFSLDKCYCLKWGFSFFWVQHETSPNPGRSSCRHCTRPQTQPRVLHGPAAFWTHDVGEGFIVQFFNQTHIWAYCEDFWL